MIKKIIALGIIIITGLINFSNAGKTQTISLESYNSNIDSNYKITFLKGGAFLTNYLGQGKSVLALRNNVLVWWTENGFPYFYLNSSNVPYFGLEQGFPDRYFICDEITQGQTNTPGNCTQSETRNYSGDNTQIKKDLQGFFKKVNLDDLVYYEFTDFNREVYMHICRNSSEIGNSLCFKVGKDNHYISGNVVYHKAEPLINSQNLTDLTFGNINNSRIYYAPGQNGYDGNRENDTNSSIVNVGSCPTIGQLMQNMGEKYNTGLCYNNTTYFNGTTFEQVEKQDIFTIFNNNYQNYVNRISIYRNNCKAPATNQACQNAFSGEYKKYSIISNAINSNVDEKKLRNYCNYGLNYDPNTTTCVASGGGIKEEYNNEEIINDLVNKGIIVTPGTNGTGSNNVLNALNKCENGDRECYVNNRNFIDSLKNIYGKITGLFKERNGVNGIIPNYILRITFLTILLTVIFKK